MRTLVGSTSSGVAAQVTAPGYLIEFSFSSVQRWSTRGTISWNSLTWTEFDVQVQGLAADGSSSALNGSLIIGNADLAISTLVLTDGVVGRSVKVWAYYGDSAPALADPVLLFDGVADVADIPSNGPVRITLEQSGGKTQFCPRTYMTAASGFSHLPATGQIVTWNGETVRLSEEGI